MKFSCFIPRGTKITPIYNAFTEAVDYRSGTVAASNAIYLARRLGVPNDIVIYGNIEYDFPVNAVWISGWVDTFYPSGYRPGLYASQTRGDFADAYCQAQASNQKVAAQLIIWGQDPIPGPTTASTAPTYQSDELPCAANIWLWQYGKGAEPCGIDTNLALSTALEYMW